MTVAVRKKLSRVVSLSDADDPMIGYVPLRALYVMFSGAGGNCTGIFGSGGYTVRVYWKECVLVITDEGGGPIMLDQPYTHLEVEMVRKVGSRLSSPKMFEAKADRIITAFAGHLRSEIHEQSHQPIPELTMLIHTGVEHSSEHLARLRISEDEVMAGFYICMVAGHGFIDEEDAQERPLNPFWP